MQHTLNVFGSLLLTVALIPMSVQGQELVYSTDFDSETRFIESDRTPIRVPPEYFVTASSEDNNYGWAKVTDNSNQTGDFSSDCYPRPNDDPPDGMDWEMYAAGTDPACDGDGYYEYRDNQTSVMIVKIDDILSDEGIKKESIEYISAKFDLRIELEGRAYMEVALSEKTGTEKAIKVDRSDNEIEEKEYEISKEYGGGEIILQFTFVSGQESNAEGVYVDNLEVYSNQSGSQDTPMGALKNYWKYWKNDNIVDMKKLTYPGEGAWKLKRDYDFDIKRKWSYCKNDEKTIHEEKGQIFVEVGLKENCQFCGKWVGRLKKYEGSWKVASVQLGAGCQPQF